MNIFSLLMAFAPFVVSEAAGFDGQAESDSLGYDVELEEVSITASPKDNGSLRSQPTSVSMVAGRQLRAAGINSLKGVSSLVPNFFTLPALQASATSSSLKTFILGYN